MGAMGASTWCRRPRERSGAGDWRAGEGGDRGIMRRTARQNTENRTGQRGKLHLMGLGKETTLCALPYLSLSVDSDERESEDKHSRLYCV